MCPNGPPSPSQQWRQITQRNWHLHHMPDSGRTEFCGKAKHHDGNPVAMIEELEDESLSPGSLPGGPDLGQLGEQRLVGIGQNSVKLELELEPSYLPVKQKFKLSILAIRVVRALWAFECLSIPSRPCRAAQSMYDAGCNKHSSPLKGGPGRGKRWKHSGPAQTLSCGARIMKLSARTLNFPLKFTS